MRIATFITTAVLAFTATVVSAQKVTYDYNKGTDFADYTMYAWVRGTVVHDPIMHNRIVAALGRQLAAKGLRLVESGWGGFRYPGNFSGSVRTDEIVDGTLIVDMVDARSRIIVWRGIATREIEVKAA